MLIFQTFVPQYKWHSLSCIGFVYNLLPCGRILVGVVLLIMLLKGQITILLTDNYYEYKNTLENYSRPTNKFVSLL